jgi:Alpha/beta hydrolase domain
VGSAQGTVDWPFNAKCDPEIPLMDPSLISYVFNASFAALDQWVRKGTPAPRSSRVELKDAGTPQASVVTDKLGHGLGGVRTPQIEAPDAAYFPSSPGPGTCREMGHKTAFDAAKIMELYGSRKNYTAKFNEAVDRLAKERWLTEGDAKRLKQGTAASSN